MRAKKHLGQHFLTSRSAAEALCKAADLRAGEVVLEIGPGTGILTAELLNHGAELVAIEKDADLLPGLRERFAEAIERQKLTLLEGDVSSFEPRKLGVYKVAANIPYYLTGDILRRFLSAEHQPLSMTLMVQKEVAERIVAKDKKESLLSLSVKAYGTPSIVKKVPAGSFSPPPKVDSAILHIAGISRKCFETSDESFFFKVLKAGFAHKRKQLGGNLAGICSPEGIDGALGALGKEKTVRAEDLSLAEWLALAKNLQEVCKTK
ncbi:MAG TPA: 16S rRNA (adenine(1518)-N(6)/adenine(1519)-N(6))-dimethyltransferase RsmA [Candidatus Paceibacterota bacterium]|nr:16S rRNA (adenine(1518)-N(6)/adenine(1519)-N(6))-dimethyltransferase RsmA [Candidatus Paceibacterota bacterium]